MRRCLLGLLVAGLVLGGLGICPAAPRAQAETLKPVAVVSLAEYDELMGDVKFVGKISDRPELGTALEGMLSLMTGGRGLEGLDKSKPVGVIIQAEGEKLHACGFLPVTSLKKLLEVVEPLVGQITEAGDGVFEVKTDDGKTLYVKEKGPGWAIVCDNKKALAAAPADPMTVVGKLNKKYDVAVRIFAQNIPEKFRQKAIEELKEGAERELHQRPGEDDLEYALRKKLTKQMVHWAVAAVNELDQISLGWALDHEAETVYLDVSATVLPDTPSAKTLAAWGKAKTKFAGFQVPGAAVTYNWLSVLPAGDVAVFAEAIDTIKPKAMAEIDRKAKNDAEARLQKELLGGLLDVAQKTIASGRSDSAVSVMLAPKAVTLVAAGYVADGPTIDKTIKRLAEVARAEHPDFVNQVVKLDADKCQEVNLHTVSIPIPADQPDREKLVKLIGETLEVVVGVGRQSVYVSAGRDAMKTLKEAIKRSSDEAKPGVPVKLSVALGPIARFVAEVGEVAGQRENAAKAVAALEKMSGADHINLQISPIQRGVRLRLELEPDVVKLIGLAGQED